MLMFWRRLVDGPLHRLCWRWWHDEVALRASSYAAAGWEPRFPGAMQLHALLRWSASSWLALGALVVWLVLAAWGVLVVLDWLFDDPLGELATDGTGWPS